MAWRGPCVRRAAGLRPGFPASRCRARSSPSSAACTPANTVARHAANARPTRGAHANEHLPHAASRRLTEITADAATRRSQTRPARPRATPRVSSYVPVRTLTHPPLHTRLRARPPSPARPCKFGESLDDRVGNLENRVSKLRATCFLYRRAHGGEQGSVPAARTTYVQQSVIKRNSRRHGARLWQGTILKSATGCANLSTMQARCRQQLGRARGCPV